jgi:hypothetical protein
VGRSGAHGLDTMAITHRTWPGLVQREPESAMSWRSGCMINSSCARCSSGAAEPRLLAVAPRLVPNETRKGETVRPYGGSKGQSGAKAHLCWASAMTRVACRVWSSSSSPVRCPTAMCDCHAARDRHALARL